jgi:hypothetical protein
LEDEFSLRVVVAAGQQVHLEGLPARVVAFAE